jgi:hypothetical protein
MNFVQTVDSLPNRSSQSFCFKTVYTWQSRIRVYFFFKIRIVGGGVQMGPLGTSATEWPIIVAKRAIHGGERAIQRGNSENPYYIPRGHRFYSAGAPGTPKLRFYPTVATIFIMHKGGDTQILIIIIPLPINLLYPNTLPPDFVVSPGVNAHIHPLSDICGYLLPRSEVILA